MTAPGPLEPQQPRRPRRLRRIPARFSGPVYSIWGAAWICMFAMGQSDIALPMMFGTAVLPVIVEPPARKPRRRDRGRLDPDRAPEPPPVPVTAAPPPPPIVAAPTPERRLAATVVRAESSGIDPDALALIREVASLVGPMLAELRRRDADPGVRHDVEAIANEHLPATLDAYLALPAEYARTHRTTDGSTPADEFRSQLTLLVEACAQLRDALRAADITRQQQLGRFLQAKFAKSDLDL